MAGELPRYTTWIRTQPCAACRTELRIAPHHSLYGTTYSPEDVKPKKAIEGARKGMAQKSHDYFSIPLCMKCHVPGIHKLGGYFEGWTREAANAWEEQQVAIHRQRYAMQSPEPAAVPAGKAKRSRVGAGWTVPLIRDWCRKEARTRPGLAAAALDELADLIERDTL